jgi:hypothetical protein
MKRMYLANPDLEFWRHAVAKLPAATTETQSLPADASLQQHVLAQIPWVNTSNPWTFHFLCSFMGRCLVLTVR